MAVHVDPGKLAARMSAGGVSAGWLADLTGLRLDLLQQGVDGTRRLGSRAMRRLGPALGVAWYDLRCDAPVGRARPCPACEATNRLTMNDLQPVAEAVAGLLRSAESALRAGARTSEEAVAASALLAPAAGAAARLGGGLGVDDLREAGVLGLLELREAFDLDAVSRDVARFCARGDAPRATHLALDISGVPDGPVDVAGWELVRYSADQLAALAPVPAAARLQPDPGWDVTGAERTWFLRRDDGPGPPLGRSVFVLPGDAYSDAAAALLVLNLSTNAPALVTGQFIVQPGVRVLRASGAVRDYVVEDDGHVQVIDYGRWSAHGPDRAEWDAWLRFVDVASDNVARAHANSDRHARAAVHFLKATRHHADGVFDPPGEAVLEYSIALETLLLSGDERGEVRLRFRNSAAWLAGADDEDREAVFRLAGALYDAGSAYRHGGSRHTLYDSDLHERRPHGKGAVDLSSVRRLARRLLLHGAAVAAAGHDVADLCNRAQRSASAGRAIDTMLDELYRRLGAPRAAAVPPPGP